MCAFAGAWLRGTVSLKFVDDLENTGRVEVPLGRPVLPADGVLLDASELKETMLALADAYDGCSEAAIEEVTAHLSLVDVAADTTPNIGEGTRGLGFVGQKVAMDFQLSDGRTWRTHLRAPKTETLGGANIFNADGQTVDESDTNVAAFIAAIIDKVTMPGVGTVAVTVAEFVGGYFIPSVFKYPRKGTSGSHEDGS